MRLTHIQPLESRQLLSANLGVSIKLTTVPADVLSGVASKPLITQVNLSNTGDALLPTDPDVVVTIALRNAQNQDTVLGTTTVKAKTLKNAAAFNKAIPVKTPILASLAPGALTLVAIVSGGGDVTPENNTALGKAVTAAPATADLSLTATSSLSGTVAADSKGTISFTIANSGNVPAKTAATLQLVSTVNGVETVVASAKLSLNVLSTKPLSKSLAFKAPNTTSAAITSALSLRLTTTTALPNDNPFNNSTTLGSLTVSAKPAGSTGGTTFTKPFVGSLVQGSKFTFKKTGGVNFNPGFETGTWTNDAGEQGTYYTTTGTGSEGNVAMSPAAGQSFAFFALQFTPNYKPGGKTLTFGVPQAGSKGSVQYAGNTVYFK